MRFVGAPTWEALSGHPVSDSVWDDVASVPHVGLARWADLIIVAPATADLLARAAIGRADDLLAATLLTATCPVLLAPAMHTEMWEHPATRANVETLRSRGVQVIEPAIGRLTGGDSGPGRLPEPTELMRLVEASLQATVRDLEGRTLVVSVGGTREPLDPVRYLGNRSSGRQGFAVAVRAHTRGARVTVVRAHVEVPTPVGLQVIDVETAEQLHRVMLAEQAGADVVVMAAAVADFRPESSAATKIKKVDDQEPDPVILVRNPDVLMDLVRDRRDGQVIVGFAAETSASTDDLLALGRAKITRKGCDLLVVNDVAGERVFGQPVNDAYVLSRSEDGPTLLAHVSGSKVEVADTILDEIAKRLPARSG